MTCIQDTTVLDSGSALLITHSAACNFVSLEFCKCTYVEVFLNLLMMSDE